MANNTVKGGTLYYRVSDKEDDSVNVKDTSLHAAFGDLSDGANDILEVSSGVDSTTAVFNFEVKRPHSFSDYASLIGFDFNYVNIKKNASFNTGAAAILGLSTTGSEGTPLPLCNIYKMRENREIDVEGDVSPLTKDGHTINNRATNAASFEREDIAVFIATQHKESTLTQYTETFSAESDVNVHAHTTMGAVAKSKEPYISLQTAFDKNSGGHGVGAMAVKLAGRNEGLKNEMFLFYGTSGDNFEKRIYLKPATDDGEYPPAKWKPATTRGNEASLFTHPVMVAAGIGAAPHTPAAGQYAVGAAGDPSYIKPIVSKHKNAPSEGLRGMGRAYGSTKTNLPLSYADNVAMGGNKYKVMGTVNTLKNQGIARHGAGMRNIGSYSKAASKKAGPVGVVLGAAEGAYMGRKRAQDLGKLSHSSDFSGVNRPLIQPLWKNKKIKKDIKFKTTTLMGETMQLDSNGVTATTTWFDNVKEVKDYEKLSTSIKGFTGDSGVSQSYGSDESKLAKSSINFEAGKEGNCMHMMAYHDYDLSQNAANQPDVTFGSLINPLQQDIYVSKHNLPSPTHFFQAKQGHVTSDVANHRAHGVGHYTNGNSVATKSAPDGWELKFDMMVGDLPKPYAIGYQSTGNSTVLNQYKEVFRRGIAVTFSNKKPKDNETFYDYVCRHGTGAQGTGDAWSYTSNIAGWIIKKKIDFVSSGTDNDMTFGTTVVKPISERISFSDPESNSDYVDYIQPTEVDNVDSHLQDLTFSDGRERKIPDSTWLTFKVTSDLHGASQLGDKNYGRYYLTIHKEDGTLIDDMANGGSIEGPICLTGTLDSTTSPVVDYNSPRNQPANWLKHMTIWVCNHRFNCGANMNEIGDRTVVNTASDGDEATNLDLFAHDQFQKHAYKNTIALNSNAIMADPYELSKTECWVDNMTLKGVEPKVVNMSVNDNNNTNSPRQNEFIADDSIITKYAGDLGTTSPAAEMVYPPKVLSMGFKTTTNMTGGTDSSTKYLLFNDFWQDGDASNALTNEMDDDGTHGVYKKFQLYAGYINNDETKMGDFIDSFSSRTSAAVGTVYKASGNYSSSDTTILTDGAVITAYNVEPGDLLKTSGSEIMKVVSATYSSPRSTLVVQRGAFGTTAATLNNDVTLYVYGKSNFTNLTIGGSFSQDDNALPDIQTGATGSYPAGSDDAFDSNSGSSAKVYVEGFSQKGMVQINNAMSSWKKRENIYSSTRITAIGNDDEDSKTVTTMDRAEITVGNPQIFKFINGPPQDGGEQYIIYEYGETQDFTDSNGNAAIVWVENVGDTITVRRDSSTDLGSGKRGARLDGLLVEGSLPKLFISPYRYWLLINMDGMNDPDLEHGNGRTAANVTDAPTQRGYASLLTVDGPTYDGSTSAGLDFGTTYNETKFYASGGFTPYQNYQSFDIAKDAAYETEIDFGFGAYDQDSALGGQVTTFRADYGSQRVDLDSMMAADCQPGDILSFCMAAMGGSTPGSKVFMWSGDYTAGASNRPTLKAHGIPQLVSKYFVPKLRNPGLGVSPNEDNPYYPELHYAVDNKKFWYGYAIVDEKPIENKYHDIFAYAPLNENVDGPWLGNVSSVRGGDSNTLKRMKLYGNSQAIGYEQSGAAATGDKRVNYLTTNSLQTGSTATSGNARGTMEGLAGRALDTRDGGYVEWKHTTNRSSSMENDQCSIIIHVTGKAQAGDDTLLAYHDGSDINQQINIKQVSNKVVARFYDSAGDYVDLTSVTSLHRDGTTPNVIIATFDKDLLEGNCKLYLDGRLEAQSGALKTAKTATNWQFGRTLSIGNNNLQIGAYDGIYEEVLLHHTCIYPFTCDESDGSIVLEKPFEEILDSTTGASKTMNARIFVFDYHNLRGDSVATSEQVSWSKAAFAIDGT